MTFRLRTIQTSADGRPIVRDRDIAGESVTIGRAAGNDIHLSDLALDPRHAAIAINADGRLHVSASGTLGFTLDGRAVDSGTIDPALGAELGFGQYRLTVGRDADGAVLLTLEDAAVRPAGGPGEGVFSLSGLLPGKRMMAWLFAAVILLAFLVVPVTSNLLRDRSMPAEKIANADQVFGDAAWSTGPLSLAHRSLEDKCEACHVRPFESVRDETCRACHKDVAEHASPHRLALARGSAPLTENLLRSVAHKFGKRDPGACSECHVEHQGADRMAPPTQAFCAECHQALTRNVPETLLGDAADFGRIHPHFRPTVPLTAGSGRLTRVSLAASPREKPGLKFPHNLHLDPRGGVAQMAARIGSERGYGMQGLVCKDCHHANDDGVRFMPVKMERDCEGCHSLAYDRVGNIFRRLRHGDVNQMIADLSVAPASSRGLVSGRKRPGDFAPTGRYFAQFAPAAGGIGLPAIALSRDGICGECHMASAVPGRLAVLPVTQVTRYMPHGWFSHRAHRQEKCAGCHKADQSRVSADLLLPDIATCRTCHGGEGAKGAKVPSGCAMCHNYHLSAGAPRGTELDRKD